MWIVSNQLKGVLKFPALNLEVAAEGEADLDILGREKAEGAAEIRVALENGYLKTVRKTVNLEETEVQRMIEDRIAEIKKGLVAEISSLYAQNKG